MCIKFDVISSLLTICWFSTYHLVPLCPSSHHVYMDLCTRVERFLKMVQKGKYIQYLLTELA
jgi:hypothetical protein